MFDPRIKRVGYPKEHGDERREERCRRGNGSSDCDPKENPFLAFITMESIHRHVQMYGVRSICVEAKCKNTK